MRYSLALAFTMLAACGTDPLLGNGTDGGGSGSGSGTPDAGVLQPPARGFQVTSPDIVIQPGQEITYCWYFKTPNTELYSIKRWESLMTDGSHHLILFFTNQLAEPEGTVSASNCGLGNLQSGFGAWVYSAQNAHAEMALPTDDGTGKPLGMDVAPGQPAFLQMHYLNTTDAPITVHANLNAEAHEASVQTTKTFAYVTYNGNISIPPMSTGVKATNTCNIPASSKTWLMSTHAHKQAVHTEVRDGMPASTDIAFQSNDWEHPGAQAWMSSPFYQFDTGKLTYECTYNNPTNRTITSGDSAATDEMCMASGYIFPATKTTICYNSFVLP